MDRLLYTYLLIFYCCTLVCSSGRHRDSFPSCEVQLMVQRGRIRKAAPQQRVAVKCPAKHCGKALNVTWCKVLEDKCEQINPTANVEITQDDGYAADKLTSILTFRQISIHDDGLYRCNLLTGDVQSSHSINISVSDLHQGTEYSDYYAESLQGSKNSESPNDGGKLDLSWLPYFYICIGAALLVATFSLLTLLRFHGWKRILSFNHNKGEETSTHMIPDLPKDSNHSTLFLQTHFSHLKDIPSPTTVGPSQPPLMTCRNQSAVAAGETQAPKHAVYSVINHRMSGLPAGEQPTATKQNKRAEYAVINFS